MKTTKKFSTIAASVAVALALGSTQLAHAGGLQSRMDAVFNDMINVTQPGVFETQRRGVLSGGSVYVRSPVMNTDLVNLQMPSVKAGCGGIDIFGGSFSFINADQFVQLLRSVAANAKGYAFQVALDIACPDCMAWINNLQAKIQDLNESFGNSCQLAKGIVNDVAGAFGYQRDNEYSITGTVTGLYEDFFGASKNSDGSDTRNQVDTKKPESAKRIVGNIVWESLKGGNIKSWIIGAGTEDEEYSTLMSVTGSVIIPKSEEDAQNPDTGNTTNPRYLPATVEYKDLIEGGTLNVWTCEDSDTDCLNPKTKAISTTGMVKRIQEVLEGKNGSVGVIQKFSMSADNAFTAEEANLMSNLPSAIGAIVRNLSTASLSVAQTNARDLAYAVAMSWADSLLREQIKAVRQALRTNTKPEVKEALKMLDDRERALTMAASAYAKDHPTLSQIVSAYNNLQQNIWKIGVETEHFLTAATTANK